MMKRIFEINKGPPNLNCSGNATAQFYNKFPLEIYKYKKKKKFAVFWFQIQTV